jgi:alpha-mannosidase
LLSESGDHGDTYNYGPPDEDIIVSIPRTLSVDVVEAGPVRGRVEIRAIYDWPARVVDGRRAGSVPTEVVTVLELRAGERWVRVGHAWNNQARDHRVRAVFPVDPAVAVTSAECAFAVVTRDNNPEGGPSELPLATYPSRRFVQAGAVTVVHDGLLEYELTSAGLALTLVRSTGMLSRVDLPMRPMPAGPPIDVEGAQVQGPVHAAYAVCVDPSVHPYAMADEVLVPLLTARAPGGGSSSVHHGQPLSLEGAEVSALTRRDGQLEVRVFNPSDEPTTARLAGQRGWIVDLRGRPIAPWETSVDLGPWEIATLRLT